VVRAYAALEVLTAASGVALVYLLPASGTWLAPLARAAGTAAPASLQLARFGVAFLLLVVPASAMGMTLPLLVRAARAAGTSFGRALGVLYGVNTAGAVLGVVVTESLLLAALGIRGTGWVAAALDLVAAALALVFARQPRAAAAEPADSAASTAPAASTTAQLPWLIAAFGSGFALLALEVVWLRFAMLFLNDTPLAFAMMLAAVLTGIALGGLLAALLAGRLVQPARFAPLAASAAGIVGVVGYRFYPDVLRRFYAPDQDAGTLLALIVPLVLPASLASGLLFAWIGDGLRSVARGDASATGRLTFANTLGAGLGSLAAGFVLLPRAGMERSMFALFALYGVVAAVLALERGLRPLLRYGGLAALGAALLVFPFGTMRADFIRLSAGRWMSSGDRIVEVREGLTGTLVHVVHGVSGLPLFDQLATNAYSMSVNDFAGRRYMDLFALLPRALHPGMKDALIIGYGIGNTAAAVAADPEIERIDLVDVSADILTLARGIHPRAARHPLDDPRLRVHVEDGRYFLQTSERQFDLITGEPPPPIMAGVVNLYTTEYFALLRARLAPGGMASYWLPIMNISASTTKSLIRGFCEAFSDCSLWHASGRNFMLLGTRDAGRGGPVSAERFGRAFADKALQDELAAIAVELPAQLGAMFVGDAEYLRELTADSAPLTDDQPMRMHQAGTRDERDALAWQWRDTTAARGRFEHSALVARLFPESVRTEALRQFENQRLLNDLLFPGETAARQMRVVHQVLHGTRLRLPVLLLLLSDPDIQRALARAPADVRARPEWTIHLAAGALAERDYPAALELLTRTPDDQLPLPDLREYVRYVIGRSAQGR
jgi:predicted membrane-bound spermidine synthase